MDLVILYGGILLILSVAAFVKGIVGFGSSLIAIPLIAAYFLSPTETRVLVVTINLMLNIYLFIKADTFNLEGFKTFLPLIVSVLVASILSGFILERFDSNAFNLTLGILLIIAALNQLLGLKVTIKHPKRYFIPVGLLGGALNTLIGAGSIPILIFLGFSNLKKEDFRTTIILFLMILNSSSILSFTVSGFYPISMLLVALSMIPFLLLASYLGILSKNRINETFFQKFVALFILAIGLNTIFTWI
jgi:uncharacterized membrane protein YfcA